MTTGSTTPSSGANAKSDKPEFESVAAKKSPMMVTAALKGIRFPASQKELYEHAKAGGAIPDVLANIEKLPEGQYQQMMDVTHNLGKVL